MIRVHLDLDGTLTDVFDYFADFRNENEWNSVAHDVVQLGDGPIDVGARFRGEYDRMGTMEYEIVEFRRPEFMRVKGTAKSFSWVSTFTFTRQSDSVRVDGTMDPHPKGVMKMMTPFLGPLIRGQMVKGMTSLKQVFETKHRQRA